MAEPIIKVSGLNKSFVTDGKENKILSQVDLEIRAGEILSVIGPSGCGKSTLLRIIGGLDTAHAGTVLFQGEAITGPSRKRGFIFQDHRLLPWLTVEDNIKFSLPAEGKEAADLVEKNLRLVGLLDYRKAYPKQLSGGMAQRVAIARALANQPKMLLLDEPFGALDAITRIYMQEELLALWELERITMVLVTHDIDEAVYLGHRVVVLDSHPGRIRKIHDVELPVPRSHTSPEFHNQKDRIYNEFFQKTKVPFSYSI